MHKGCALAQEPQCTGVVHYSKCNNAPGWNINPNALMLQGGALASIRISGAPRDPRTLRNSTRQGLLWGQGGPAMSPFEPEMSPFAPFRCHYSASEPFWMSTFDPNVHFAIGTRVRGHGKRDRNGRALPALNIPAYFSPAIQSNPPKTKTEARSSRSVPSEKQ